MRINPISNQIYFQGGLKKNIRQGERALREFKEEFPHINSATFWQMRLDKIENKKHIKLKGCEDVVDKYHDGIRELRRDLRHIKDEKEKQKEQFKEVSEKKVGNCGETTDIISGKLDEMGVPHKNLGFRMTKAMDLPSDHVFSVIGLDDDANIKNPSSWGNDAVVVDGWMNFVLSAPKAIEEYEKFFDGEYKKGSQKYDSDFSFDFKECI